MTLKRKELCIKIGERSPEFSTPEEAIAAGQLFHKLHPIGAEVKSIFGSTIQDYCYTDTELLLRLNNHRWLHLIATPQGIFPKLHVHKEWNELTSKDMLAEEVSVSFEGHSDSFLWRRQEMLNEIVGHRINRIAYIITGTLFYIDKHVGLEFSSKCSNNEPVLMWYWDN